MGARGTRFTGDSTTGTLGRAGRTQQHGRSFMMRNAVKASGASIFTLATLVSAVGLVGFGGCVNRDEPPFNPREMGRNARIASRERIIKPKPEIPTTMQARPST